tara:strand:- start:23 stop:229 length:207 start_codon:yes stop_codon:yes gene_type:complete
MIKFMTIIAKWSREDRDLIQDICSNLYLGIDSETNKMELKNMLEKNKENILKFGLNHNAVWRAMTRNY